MPKFEVPYQLAGTIEVEANSKDDAINKVQANIPESELIENLGWVTKGELDADAILIDEERVLNLTEGETYTSLEK